MDSDFNELISIACETETFLRNVPNFDVTDSESLDSMAYYFFKKQLEHHHTFVYLYSLESPDLLLIVRSMIEGWAMLNYGLRGKSIPHGMQWEAFLPLAQLMELKAFQKKADPGLIQSIEMLETLIDEKLSKFVTTNGKGLPVKNKKYYYSWYKDISIDTMIKDTHSDMIVIYYKKCANWHHWNPLVAKDTFSNTCTGPHSSEYSINFDKMMPMLCDSVFIAFTCMVNTAHLVAEHFHDSTMKDSVREYNSRFITAAENLTNIAKML